MDALDRRLMVGHLTWAEYDLATDALDAAVALKLANRLPFFDAA